MAPVWVVGVVSRGCDDVVPAREALVGDDRVVQGGHDRRCLAGSDTGPILVEAEVTDLVKLVFYTPVVADT